MCVCVCVSVCVHVRTLSCENVHEWMGGNRAEEEGMIGVRGLRSLSVSVTHTHTHTHTGSPASIEHQEINLLFPLSKKKEEQKDRILLQRGDSFYLLTTSS